MNDVWKKVLEGIQEKIAAPSLETWFKRTDGELVEGRLIVYAESEFARDWIENRYKDLIQDIVKGVTGEDTEVVIRTDEKEIQQTVLNGNHSDQEALLQQFLSLEQSEQKDFVKRLADKHDIPIKKWLE